VKKYAGLAIFAAMAALVVYTRGFEEAAVFFSALFVHEAFHILAAAGLGYQINSFGPGAFGLRSARKGRRPPGFAGAFFIYQARSPISPLQGSSASSIITGACRWGTSSSFTI
jgi:hypothetical protein